MMRSKKRLLRAAAAAVTAFRFGNETSLRAEASSDGKPKWNQLFPKGTHHNGGWPTGGVTVDDDFCATMIANWQKRSSAPAVVDYFHKTNDEEAPKEERIASGWILDLQARADGVWALIDWTDAARARILARELGGLSPEWAQNGLDAKTGQRQGPTLICAALLTNPAFKDLPHVAAAEVPSPEVTEYAMNRAQIDAMLKAAGITLAAGASDADAAAALSKHVTDTAKASFDAAELLKAKQKTDADALKASEDREKVLKAQLAEAVEDKAKLGVRVANIEKIEADRAVSALCKRAIDEGRIAAAAVDSVKSLAAAAGLEKATAFVDTFAKGTVASTARIGLDGPGEAPGKKELQAKYDTELDAALKAGESIAAASKRIARNVEFAPLFTIAAINAKA